MDVDTAFLHADIQEEIYIKPREGFALPEGINCFKLKKALFELKQSPREWYNNKVQIKLRHENMHKSQKEIKKNTRKFQAI